MKIVILFAVVGCCLAAPAGGPSFYTGSSFIPTRYAGSTYQGSIAPLSYTSGNLFPGAVSGIIPTVYSGGFHHAVFPSNYIASQTVSGFPTPVVAPTAYIGGNVPLAVPVTTYSVAAPAAVPVAQTYTAEAVEPGYVAKTTGVTHKAALPKGLGFASHHINLQPAPGTE